ncbi:ectoine hydroxylase-related dioxygenase (phytanoyl-CoA dioxygenase family) [Nocardia sp. GAS34]|uniref:phytanoyl-CoA dioxygenase family protein n=1 Tax=unclassified Nocardia TaxID=2637762 RepID=UPI003D237B96
MNYRFSYPVDDAGVDDIASALKTHGLAIVTNVLDSDTVSKLMNTIEPEFSADDFRPSDGEKYTVQAVPGLLGIDPIYAETLLLNSIFLSVADRILAPRCHNYRVQISTGMRIPAGGVNQFLHREMDIYRPFLPYDTVQAEYVLFAMWAGTDFTLENGATRMVPGSHLWDEQRSAQEHEIVRAEMPSGSVAMWLGTTLHAGAANKTRSPRTGFICALGVDWLVQQENQLITIPPEAARKLPEKAQRLLGYQASPMYGWARGMRSDNLLEVDRSASRYVNAGLHESAGEA